MIETLCGGCNKYRVYHMFIMALPVRAHLICPPITIASATLLCITDGIAEERK